MTAPADPRLRQQARSVLARHADGAAGADAIAAAADRSYGDLVRVLTPVIGSVGVNALAEAWVSVSASSVSSCNCTWERCTRPVQALDLGATFTVRLPIRRGDDSQP